MIDCEDGGWLTILDEAEEDDDSHDQGDDGDEEESRKDAAGAKRGRIGQANENEALVETGAHFCPPRQKWKRPMSINFKKMTLSSRRERHFREK